MVDTRTLLATPALPTSLPQTVANSKRSPAASVASKAAGARVATLEHAILYRLAATVCSAEPALKAVARAVAVVDVSVPMGDGVLGSDAVGSRILQILRRLDQPPPTVVVRPPQPSQRDATRGLHAMLAEGAFAVLDRPFPVESLLETLRRILQRHYAGTWPTGHAS